MLPYLLETLALAAMDLVGSESRKTGTRGGRADFRWDTVKAEERQYYLGNSIAKPLNSLRNASNPDFDWYAKPQLSAPSLPTSTTASASASATSKDIQALRQRERAMVDSMVVGRSFSDAVRSALTESVGSGVDDEGACDAAAAAERRAVRRREKTEKAQRKEMRRRIRELRRTRRAEKNRRRDKHHQAQTPQHDSSESERESIRSRLQDEAGRRRRRRERDSTTCRKRHEWCSTSDSEDPDRHRARRQRLR